MRTQLIVAVLLLLALAAPAAPVQAGGVVAVCDEFHLRMALIGGGTVTFACSGVIALTHTITIAADTTIDGSGQAVAISGNDSVRVLTVNPLATLSLDGLTVANGRATQGGGIHNDGMLLVNQSVFSGHVAYQGGAISNSGVLTVSHSTLADNRATGAGGAIYNTGSLAVMDSVFSNNTAGFYELGGGGIYNAGQLAVSDSTFTTNDAAAGGGIMNRSGAATVRACAFHGNSADGNGGGIDNRPDAALVVDDSTFSANGAGAGGGIANTGALALTTSTFVANDADFGGALLDGHEAGVATVSNSTFYANSAGYGGGILHIPTGLGALTIANCTFSANVAATLAGAGIHSSGGAVTLANTLVAHSAAGSNCFGAISDGGGNLSYPDPSCPGIDADPLLGPLQDNGGPTWTMALGEGSAALDQGDDAICAAPPVNSLDQRGFVRPWGAHCDSGALEQVQEPVAVHLAALSAGSGPAAVSPTLLAGLLLAALAGFGARRRRPTAG
jgi:hypothetical protein